MNVHTSISWRHLSKDEKTTFLREHFTSRTSAGNAVKELRALGVIDLTRNALIGHIHRHMPGEILGTSTRASTVAPKKSSPRPKLKNYRRGGMKSLQRSKKGVVAAPPEMPDPSKAKVLEDLADSDCRCPLWGHHEKGDDTTLFCGMPKQFGSSYCAHHHKIFNVTMTEREANGLTDSIT